MTVKLGAGTNDGDIATWNAATNSWISAPLPPGPLLFFDDFDGSAGSAPNASYWAPQVGTLYADPDSVQYYTTRAANISLDGSSHLAITALKDSYHGGYDWSSGLVYTRNLVATTYGTIEASIKMPAGQGLWPAFWLSFLPVAIDEIDIVEALMGTTGNNSPYNCIAHIHCPITGGGSWNLGSTKVSATSLATGFHTYGVIWSATAIQFTLDGVLYATFTPFQLTGSQTWGFSTPAYLIFNLAVGGDWPGPPDGTTPSPSTMLIDWVKVYGA